VLARKNFIGMDAAANKLLHRTSQTVTFCAKKAAQKPPICYAGEQGVSGPWVVISISGLS